MTVAEQIALTAAALTVLGPPARDWGHFSAQEQTAYGAALNPPDGGFTADQRATLYAWWMPVTAGQVTALNQLLPAKTVLVARADASGNLYLPFYLLSDAINGRRLSALQSILTTLKIVNTSTITWPAPVVTAP